jgi:hypothetical protein
MRCFAGRTAPVLILVLVTSLVVFACDKDPVSTPDGTGPACLTPPDSLAGWWPLDRLGSAAEELVDNNEGDYIDVPLEAVGKVGGALRFDGSDDAIQVSDPIPDWILDITGDITLEAWIKRDTDQSGQQVIVGKSGSFYLGLRAGHIFALIPNSFDFIGASTLPTDEWIHIAVTYDVDDRIGRIYLNGEVDGAVSTSGQPVPDAGGDVFIGALMPPQQFFDGFIDEVSIYNRALATSEIREIYTRGTLGKCK